MLLLSRLRQIILSWSFLGASFLVASTANAHPLDLGYFQAELNREQAGLTTSLELNPNAVEKFAGLPLRSLSKISIGLHLQEILRGTLEQIRIETGGDACSLSKQQVKWIDETQIRISAYANCPNLKQDLSFKFLFLGEAASTFQILGKFVSSDDGSDRSFIIEKSNPQFSLLNLKQPNPHFLQFMGMGIRHIGAAPSEWMNEKGFHLPDGIDHILFILALILGGGGFVSLLKTATGFTIGHSITLALAASGILRLPSRWVESAIALSIVYVAIEALFLTDSKNRWKIAMGFGLVHGFGFAAALQELNLSRSNMLEALLGFNLGVELGQVMILAIIVPIVLWIRNYSAHSVWAVRFSAALIGMTGSYWFVMRAFVM